MKNLVVILFTILAFSCTNQQLKPDYAESVDEVFSIWKSNEPGASLGIYRNGKLEYSKGYGIANLEYNIPNSKNSVFRIASTSKQFTAACLVLLQEMGELSLEDPLSKYFPEFPEYANRITIRNLLNHTSGIRDYLQLVYLAGYSDDDFYTDEDVMELLINQKDLNFAPGDEYLYSNSGYWLLGQIVLKVSGKTLAEFAQQNIFNPLGMNHSHFHDNNSMIVPERSSGYTPVKKSFEISMTQLEMIGDGGVFTTIEDLTYWINNFKTQKIGASNFTQTMQTRGVLNNGDTLDYALGLSVTEYKGMPVIRHGGAFVGYRAELIRFPEEDVAIAILANRSDANPSKLTNQIADILFDISKEEKELQTFVEEESYTASSEELTSLAGKYWNDELMSGQEIIYKNDTLFYNKYALVPIRPNRFQIIDYPGIKINFIDNKLTIKQASRELREYDSYIPPVYSSSDLESIAGTYYSDELRVHYSIKLLEGELMLYIEGKKISAFTPTIKNIFINDEIGTFNFIKSNNNIKGFVLASGRFKNLHFNKK